DRLDVFGLGVDYSVYHKTYDAAANQWTPDWQDLGGNFTCTPVAVSTSPETIDLFGLGPDQTMLHRRLDGNVWIAWEELGGAFTTPPVVLANSNGSFDIFARGLDFQIYTTSWMPGTTPSWQLLGGGLLGAPTAASVPAVIRVRGATLVFVTGSDAAVWMTIFDGIVWKAWTSLGPAQTTPTSPGLVNLKTPPVVTPFVSEPVVCAFDSLEDHAVVGERSDISVGPRGPVNLSSVRIDVFAVGKDHALYHKWLDKDGWHGAPPAPGSGSTLPNAPLNWMRVETQPLGAAPGQHLTVTSCACAPALYPLSTSASPIDLAIIEPTVAGNGALITYDGTEFTATGPTPIFRLPTTFKFTMDSFFVGNPRSADTDTDYVTVTLSVGKWPIRSLSDGPYDGIEGMNNPIPFPLETLATELCEPVFFTYTIINTGNQSTASSIQSAIVSGAESLVSSVLSSLATPGPKSIAFNGVRLATSYAGATILGVAPGTIIGVLGELVVGSLLDYLLPLVFADCDGVVVVDQQGFQKARDVQQLFATLPATENFNQETRFLGSDSPHGCFANSDYTVRWSIARPLP
ncbi:MAG: hypothetical protein WA814_04255, partial [Candidatus Baltobacteraceae bacterium]